MTTLLYLKHGYALSDDDTAMRWSENPYWPPRFTPVTTSTPAL